jgi:uncharacterized OB-fold protein
MSDPVKVVKSPVRIVYTVRAGRDQSEFLRAVGERRFIGKRCPSCRRVNVPPRGACPRCGVALAETLEVGPSGTVTTFCIVNVPFEGRVIDLPYCYANVLLDGADLTIPALVQGIAVSEVRMGLRVAPEWVDGAEMRPSLESIRCFRPTGEPDAPRSSYEEHV